MSYVGHGDLEEVRNRYPATRIRLRLAAKKGTPPGHKYVPETAICSIFQQLNQACILMEYGTTDDENRSESWEQIVHLDFKPENIFLDAPVDGSPYPRAVLGDFGISVITREDDELNPLFFGNGIGTAGYMAPEQVLYFNSKTFDPVPLAKVLAWTNIWAMDAVLAQTMRGIRLERNGAYDALESSSTWDDGPEIYQWFDAGVNGHYSQELRDIITKCLQYDPASRPTNLEIRDTIRTYLAGNPIDDESEPLEFNGDDYKEGMTFT